MKLHGIYRALGYFGGIAYINPYLIRMAYDSGFSGKMPRSTYKHYSNTILLTDIFCELDT